jgi:ankyrin repeat protein
MPDDPRTAFIEAAIWHGSLPQADQILAAHPELAASDVHIAAILGDATAVRRILATDPGSATRRSAPYGGDALVYLCLSRYLQAYPSRSADFCAAAAALLDAGADPNGGFWTTGDQPEFESALYGAAGVAHDPGLTRLLLERGADPNDNEAVYHSPETHDNRALRLLVETGRLTADSLALMLVRKHDWHDYEGVKYLLEHGADPNREWRPGVRPMHHAILRDNALEIVVLLLDHGADPTLLQNGRSAVALAAGRGRRDLLEAFEQRGISTALHGVDRLIAQCARGDVAAIADLITREPALVGEILDRAGKLLAEFASVGNTGGVARLLDLGVDIETPYGGDPYFDIATGSTALHVAAWRARPVTVRHLLQRGARVNVRDGQGRTPLALAVKACVDSYWAERRSPDSIEALLRAGATPEGIALPTGYQATDDLLRAHGSAPGNP